MCKSYKLRKVLITTDVPVCPIDSGNNKAICECIKILENLGCEVMLLLLTNHHTNKNAVKKTKELYKEHCVVYRASFFDEIKYSIVYKIRLFFFKSNFCIDDFVQVGMRHFVRHFTNQHKFDCVIVNYVYYSKLLECCNVKIKAIFTHDVFSFRQIRTNRKTYSLSPNEEAKGLARCDYILAVQENEAIFFNYLSPKNKTLCVYMPTDFKKVEICNDNNVVLFFSGDNPYNVEGIKWFIEKVFPLVLEKNKKARLLLGGSICDKVGTFLKSCASVEMLGFFDNPESFYKRGNICINPVFNGTGLKIKTIEAIAFGKSIVVHPHSAEGIFEKLNAPIFFASQPEDFAKKLLDLMASKSTFVVQQEKCEKYMLSYNSFILHQYEKLLGESEE